jgi:hypothetical protein
MIYEIVKIFVIRQMDEMVELASKNSINYPTYNVYICPPSLLPPLSHTLNKLTN